MAEIQPTRDGADARCTGHKERAPDTSASETSQLPTAAVLGATGMIPPSDLPAISTILSRLDISPGQRGRTKCPIHRGDNLQAFSFDDKRGQWYCFRCGFGGDAVELVKRSLGANFKTALRWLGLELGKPPAPDPVVIRKRKEQLQHWAELLQLQRELRDEYRLRNLIAFHAGQRLRVDPDSWLAWELLDVAYSGRPLGAIEHELDELLASIPREAYRGRKTA